MGCANTLTLRRCHCNEPIGFSNTSRAALRCLWRISWRPRLGYQSRAAAAPSTTEIGGGENESEHGRVHERILQEDAITSDTLGPL